MGILKLIENSLVGPVTVHVIIGHNPSSIFKLLRQLDRMGIVVPHNPLSVEVMQCQRVTNPVRNLGSRSYLPCLNLDPVPIALGYDLIVQIKEGVDSGISRQQSYHQLIIFQKHSYLKLENFYAIV